MGITESHEEQYQMESLHKRLLSCAKEGKIKEVAILLQLGANINTRDRDGWTSLHWCAGNGYTELGMLLIEKGADLCLRTHDGFNPLQLASWYGHEEIVDILVSKCYNFIFFVAYLEY